MLEPIVIPANPSSNSLQDYELFIYRGDLENQAAPGNKWHKLKHHLCAASQHKAKVIATFAGPYSNHLHAFANTLETLGVKGICVVRGELQANLTATLKDAAKSGIELWPSSRADYRLGVDSLVAAQIHDEYGDVYWVPEGGGGILGAKGCQEWAQDIAMQDNDFDAWAVAAGTGTTAAGFLSALEVPFLHVFSALKGAADQQAEIVELAGKLNSANCSDRLKFHSDCHHGGYAKHSEELRGFMKQIAQLNPNLILDPVYTNKALFAIIKAMHSGQWLHRRTLFIHTGGIQGWRGYQDEHNPFLKVCSHSES